MPRQGGDMWVVAGLKPVTEPFIPILVGTSLEGVEGVLRTVKLWSLLGN